MRAAGNGLQAFREFADFRHGIVFLDVPAAAGDGDAVEHLEEIEVQRFEQRFCGALRRGKLAPCVEGLLCAAEDFINRVRCIQLGVDLRGIAFIGEGKLVAQVGKAVVDRRGGEHQHLRLHACTDDLVHQAQIAVLAFILTVSGAAVAEVVGFVDHHQIIVAPVDSREIDLSRMAVLAGEVGVVQHVVAEPILRNGVVDVVALVGHPVFGELLGAEHEHGFVPVFVILDHSQRCKGLAQTDAVRKNAAIEGFELVDDGKRRIPLEVVQHFPDLGVLEAGCLIRQIVL